MLDEKDLQAIAALVHSEVSGSENRLMAYIESSVQKNIKILAEGHEIILNHLPDADQQEQLKSRVSILERVVVDMRAEIESLKKAQ